MRNILAEIAERYFIDLAFGEVVVRFHCDPVHPRRPDAGVRPSLIAQDEAFAADADNGNKQPVICPVYHVLSAEAHMNLWRMQCLASWP